MAMSASTSTSTSTTRRADNDGGSVRDNDMARGSLAMD
eukprot:CAMPEP_0182564172 /NCGR_PEP_ID=MMETSP1324-20130603/6162_1 /TAXON_ID=236786 /ORGANISM="Florenciella sp., Strain RCC1587" /LENGTH=37 /DNA_ID= /DNA_START= /DNA_END= /DNA_ORIENTATION=